MNNLKFFNFLIFLVTIEDIPLNNTLQRLKKPPYMALLCWKICFVAFRNQCSCQNTSYYNLKNCTATLCKNNGTCGTFSDGNETYSRCSCMPGFGGMFCEIIDYCRNVACSGRGECVNTNDESYVCNCQFGKSLAVVLDSFKTSHSSGSFFYQGFSGDNCENTVDFCSPNPCQNGANCVNDLNGLMVNYKCQCTNQYYGLNCAFKNFCSSNPCRDPSLPRCQNTPSGFVCQPAWNWIQFQFSP